MRRLVLLYLALFPAALLAAGAVSAVVFSRVDLGREAFAATVAVPALQAAVVAALTRSKSAPRVVATLAGAPGVRTVAALLAVDLLLLAASVARPADAVWGVTAGGVPPVWAAVKGLAAGAAFLALAARADAAARLRVLGAAAGAGLAAFSLDAFLPWLAQLPYRVLYGWSLLYKWLATYAPLWLTGMAVLLALAPALSRRSPAAALLADGACGAALLAGLVVVLNVFLRPYLVEPWQSLVELLGSTTMTFLLAAALLALRAPEGRRP